MTIPLWARLMEAGFVDCACECHGGEVQNNLRCCDRCIDVVLQTDKPYSLPGWQTCQLCGVTHRRPAPHCEAAVDDAPWYVRLLLTALFPPRGV